MEELILYITTQIQMKTAPASIGSVATNLKYYIIIYNSSQRGRNVD